MNQINKTSDAVLEAIEKIVAPKVVTESEEGEKGVDLLAIMKKVNRNRRKGQSPE